MPSGETLSEEGHERGFGLVELEGWNLVNEEDFLTIGYYSILAAQKAAEPDRSCRATSSEII